MKLLRSFKRNILQNRRWVKFNHRQPISYYYRKWPPLAAAYLVWILVFTAVIIAGHSSSGVQQPENGKGSAKFGRGFRLSLPKARSLTLQSRVFTIGQPTGSSGVNGATVPVANLTLNHQGITTTIFWAGEPASADNGYIANNASAWDGQWKTHYGGFDDPNHRTGFLPAAFTPKENPFYFALPYSDITDNGLRKASAGNCPFYAVLKNQPYSWCKNGWITITHGGKTVYAQWEDVGPFEEDDLAYVFGSSAPQNKQGAKAGLDVSPAVRDYLGLQDVDNCDWNFVSADSVPAGPWRQIITSSLGDSL